MVPAIEFDPEFEFEIVVVVVGGLLVPCFHVLVLVLAIVSELLVSTTIVVPCCNIFPTNHFLLRLFHR